MLTTKATMNDAADAMNDAKTEKAVKAMKTAADVIPAQNDSEKGADGNA